MFLGGSYETIRSFLGDDRMDGVKENKKKNIAKFQGLKETNPMFNFFAHCRNAAFHGNKFKLNNNAFHPSRCSAEWGQYKITENDHGAFLFPDKLSPKDVVGLLLDISTLF